MIFPAGSLRRARPVPPPAAEKDPADPLSVTAGPASPSLPPDPSPQTRQRPAPRGPGSLRTRTARRSLRPPSLGTRAEGRPAPWACRPARPAPLGQPAATGALSPAAPLTDLPPLGAARPRPPAAPRSYSPPHPSSNGSAPRPFSPPSPNGSPRRLAPSHTPPAARSGSVLRSRRHRHRRDLEVLPHHFRGEGVSGRVARYAGLARPGDVSARAFSSRECPGAAGGCRGCLGHGGGGSGGGPRAGAAPSGRPPTRRADSSGGKQPRRARDCLYLFNFVPTNVRIY